MNLIVSVLLRHIGGWSLILLGLLGLVLPVLPGILLVVLGIVVLGPNDSTLRRIELYVRLGLRRWSRARHPGLRWAGWKARRMYYFVRLQVREHLHQHQHGKSVQQVYFLLLAVAGILFVTIAGMFFI